MTNPRSDTVRAESSREKKADLTGQVHPKSSGIQSPTAPSTDSGAARDTRSPSNTAYRWRCQETSTIPRPRSDGPCISTMASEGNEVSTPALSESAGGHNRIAASGVLIVYVCIENFQLCMPLFCRWPVGNANELTITASETDSKLVAAMLSPMPTWRYRRVPRFREDRG